MLPGPLRPTRFSRNLILATASPYSSLTVVLSSWVTIRSSTLEGCFDPSCMREWNPRVYVLQARRRILLKCARRFPMRWEQLVGGGGGGEFITIGNWRGERGTTSSCVAVSLTQKMSSYGMTSITSITSIIHSKGTLSITNTKTVAAEGAQSCQSSALFHRVLLSRFLF